MDFIENYLFLFILVFKETFQKKTVQKINIFLL